jgi:DNA-binding transcriptional ArsR family regulator
MYVQFALSVDCRAVETATALDATEFIPGVADSPAQAVVPDGDAAADHDEVEPLVARTDGVVCRLDGCRDDCLACNMDIVPVEPYQVRCVDGALLLDIAARSGTEVECIQRQLKEHGADVEPRRLSDGDPTGSGPQAVVDLSRLTDRQREAAAIAIDEGYFTSDGADAGAVADRLGVSQSTLSEHLRAVESELLSQALRPVTNGVEGSS